MNDQHDRSIFQSSQPFDAERIGAAAVYCSDGRFGGHFDEFLHNSLQLPRYDRLAVPGGAACLAGHFSSFREEESLLDQLRFLVRVHGLQRVVLIAHQDCAYYPERLHTSPLQLETQQREDMQTAIRRVRSITLGLQVDAFFARKNPDGGIRFEMME